jgi:hypothetical protein
MREPVVKQRINRLRNWLSGWPAVVLGAIAGFGIVLSSSQLGAIPRPHSYRWFFHLQAGTGIPAHLYLYLAALFFVGAWWALGASVTSGWLNTRRVWIAFSAWAAPFYLGVPVFSRDIYSYIAQGKLVHLGFNPYVDTPVALGNSNVVESIAQAWQNTPSPYGPLLTMHGHLLSLIFGDSLIGQVLVYRTAAILGVVALSLALVPLATRRGVDPIRALWLVTLSPLLIISVVSTAHNDIYMLALVIGGILLADHGHRRSAYCALALAATIKAPAFAVIGFILVHELIRSRGLQRLWLIVEAGLASIISIVAATLLAGFGWFWATPAAFKIPTSVRTVISPSIAVGSFFAQILRLCHVHASRHHLVSYFEILCGIGAVFLVLFLLKMLGRHDYLFVSGLALLGISLLSPTLWPWYYLWAIVILAASHLQHWTLLAMLAGLAAFLAGAGGSPMLGGNSFYITAPLLLLALWRFFRTGHARQLFEQGFGDDQD